MDNKQLAHYFEAYYSLVYRAAFTQLKSHADTEDVVQEVFIRLLRYQPDFKSIEHEKAWMIKTAMNLCKDVLKSKWHKDVIGMEQVPESEKQYFHVPFLEEDETLWTVLELPESYKNCLYFFYYEDYSIKEIAKLLSLPENTVKTNLRRGREAVKNRLEQAKGKQEKAYGN